MAKMIMQDLDMRIHQLRELEKQNYLDDEKRKCLQCRRTELENMKGIIRDRLRKNELRKTPNQDFWKLVDEF